MHLNEFVTNINDNVISLTGGMVLIGGDDTGGAGTAQGTTQGTVQGTAQAQEPMSAWDAMLPTMIWMVLIMGIVYFMMIRPQKKREKQMLEMQKAIGSGDNVMTSSGMYGKVVDVGEDVFVVEFGTNRGVRIPVRKADVVAIKTPKMTAAPSES